MYESMHGVDPQQQKKIFTQIRTHDVELVVVVAIVRCILYD